MREEIVERYASEVPIELRNAVKALSDDRKWAVYVALIKEGEKNFNSLKNLFEFHPEELNRVLRSLKSAGLIRKYVASLEDVGKAQRTFYAPTEFGKAFLETLYYSIMPKEEIILDLWASISLDPTTVQKNYYELYSSTPWIIAPTVDSPKEVREYARK